MLEPEADEETVAREEVEALGEVVALGLYEMCCATGLGCSCSRTIDIVEPDANDDDDTVDIDATDERCDIGGDPPPLRGSPCTEDAGVEPGEEPGGS